MGHTIRYSISRRGACAARTEPVAERHGSNSRVLNENYLSPSSGPAFVLLSHKVIPPRALSPQTPVKCDYVVSCVRAYTIYGGFSALGPRTSGTERRPKTVNKTEISGFWFAIDKIWVIIGDAGSLSIRLECTVREGATIRGAGGAGSLRRFRSVGTLCWARLLGRRTPAHHRTNLK